MLSVPKKGNISLLNSYISNTILKFDKSYMQLAEYIEQLLRKHNCVIVPEFGGFIANYKSAVIDEARGRIMPPSKRVLFNPNLVDNDGLLGNAVANSRGISYPGAMEYIAENVQSWQNELDEGKRVEIGEIGFLFKQNGQVSFEQSREVNLLLNAYGLRGISFVNFASKKEEKPIKEPVVITPKEKPVVAQIEEKKEEKEAVVIALNADQSKPNLGIDEVEIKEEEEVKVIPVKRKGGRGWRYLAVAAAVPLLFYSYWIPMETDFMDTGKIQMADFNPIQTTPNRVYQMRESDFEQSETESFKTWDELTGSLSDNVSVYNYQFDEDLYIPIKLDKTDTELPAEESAEVNVPDEITADTNLPYHVIGGCFSVKSNADQFVVDLVEQGYSASVLDLNNGLYRVTAGDYASRDEAKSQLKDFKNEGFSGWILKK